ncbi:MAG: N5-glutamine methyltransferase family protein, partial [Thermodesulfovibrionales bacterium]
MNSLQWFRQAVEKLSTAGIRFPALEAGQMLLHIGIDNVVLYRDNPEIKGPELSTLNDLLQRRLNREPLQYILGYTYFLDLKIKTQKGVLIPRPETELLVIEAIKEAMVLDSEGVPKKSQDFLGQREGLHVLDLCTGSGCIAIAIAKALSSAGVPKKSQDFLGLRDVKVGMVYGTDISEEAIKLAITNAEINNVKNVTFLKGDLFEPLKNTGLKFDIITANPPYIRTDEIPFLEPE